MLPVSAHTIVVVDLRHGHTIPERLKDIWHNIVVVLILPRRRRIPAKIYWPYSPFCIHDDYLNGYTLRLMIEMAVASLDSNAKKSNPSLTTPVLPTLTQNPYDFLSGLPDKQVLKNRLLKLQNTMQFGEVKPFALFLCDIDRFKHLNDSLGRFCGDQLLMAVADRLSSIKQPQDTLVRLGGDEFVLLKENDVSSVTLPQFAEKLMDAFALPFLIESHKIFVTCSMGIVTCPDNYAQLSDTSELLRDASTAMYLAKAKGPGQYAFFQPSMHHAAVHDFDMESRLRLALLREEFYLGYQPIVCLQTGALQGFEALLRWHSPDKGVVPPSEVVPLAEKTGLIVPIGEWVLRQAFLDLQAWQRALPGQVTMPYISVNLSPRQFMKDNLVSTVCNFAQQIPIDLTKLRLEITESMLIDNPETINQMLSHLVGMNIRVCIDDFGTGYSSLSKLYQLPIHTLKIDRSFVSRIGEDTRHTQIIEAIVRLAHSLGLDVVAEGIENVEQLRFLRDTQCEFGQGYWFSKPVDKHQAIAWTQTPPPWQPWFATQSPAK